jgi:diguanylate cyclase (GGDEF)-like protein
MGLARRSPPRASRTPPSRFLRPLPLDRRLDPRILTPLGAWVIAIGVAWVLGHRLAAMAGDLAWLATTTLIVSIAVAFLVLAGKVPARLQDRLVPGLFTVAAPLALLVAATGGARSPAAMALALLVLGFTRRAGLARGALATVAIVAAVAGGELLAGSLHVSALTAFAALSLAVGLGPLWYLRRTGQEMAVARRQLDRVEGYLAGRRHTPHGSRAIPSDLRNDAQVMQRQAETLRDLSELDRFLRDVRDLTGADEVIFWRWNQGRSSQAPVAWSTENTLAPSYFSTVDWAPLVKWSAEGEVVNCVSEEEIAYLVCGPVQSRGRLYGVLSISSRAGLTLPREGAKAWLERYADHVALMVELFDISRSYRRQMRQTSALIEVGKRIDPNKSLEDLGRSICDTALDVSSGARSALVRWHEDAAAGDVRFVTEGHLIAAGHRVTSDSILAAQCTLGRPWLQDDARALSRGSIIYGAGEPRRDIGSLTIVPLTRERRVLGAIVVEADRPGDLTPAEMKNLNLLGILAASHLEIAWEMDLVSQRARTDQLTGLPNRRCFDEHLKRVLDETDRFGAPSSLVIADIDFFKRVNDTFGHEAGDAVLRQVAQTFMEGVRTVDVCARFGGEEIAVLLPHTGLDGALELAERLRTAVETRVVQVGDTGIPVTASFGVATYPESVPSREGLFPAADKALYVAKGEGRNCVRSAPAAHYPRTS